MFSPANCGFEGAVENLDQAERQKNEKADSLYQLTGHKGPDKHTRKQGEAQNCTAHRADDDGVKNRS